MPQMAPMPWVSLEVFFLGGMFIFLSVLYFTPTSGEVLDSKIVLPQGLNWRW